MQQKECQVCVNHSLQIGHCGFLVAHLQSGLMAGSDPELLKWFAQAELMHGRWAMLAVSGILIPEWLERLGFIENFSWFEAGEREYFADPTTLFVVQLALMGWVEGRRWADIINPGSVDIEPKLPHKKNPKPDVGYPGGLWFDPMMWGRGSPEPVMVLRTKEIKNGRLAMLAFVGLLLHNIDAVGLKTPGRLFMTGV
ncbi:photosystem I light harvesting complex gene 6 [Prunus dulcis]|uniref:Chlorophyll a-b binding protein, chloroplastic n=1 Tax=Prunus dulcis TaxID=3755 RepID=A0A4Y1RWT4_PRUDU|nr:photosystem I light harvesting complex gene 6 [Prunus dulcis]